MTVTDRKRKARTALYSIPFDKRADIEQWLDENLLIGQGDCTTERIVKTLSKDFEDIEYLHEMVEWYLFSHEVEYKYSDGVLAWNLQVKEQEPSEGHTDDISVLKYDEENNVTDVTQEQEPSSNDDTAQSTDQTDIDKSESSEENEKSANTDGDVLNSQDMTVIDKKYPAPDENTIEQSKQEYGDWVGLRSWLTKNSFNKSRSNRTTYPLQTVMDYYNFEKGQQHPISFEFLRDRLLNDGFKESKTDMPLPQRQFNITLPSMKLRRRFRKSNEKQQNKGADKL